MISSPGPTSSVMSAASRASVPEDTAMACSTPSMRASSCSSAAISGPMMKRWLSATRVMADRISSRNGRYCVCRSSSGTFDVMRRSLYKMPPRTTETHGHERRSRKRHLERPFRVFRVFHASVSVFTVRIRDLRGCLPPRLDRGARFPIDFAALDRLALVVVLLASGEADCHLHAAVLEIHANRHERHAALHGLANQLSDLVAMEQQLAAPERFVVRVPAVAVRADVHVVQKHFPIFDSGEAVAQVDAPFTDRFHFGAEQHHTRLETLEQVVVVAGLAVFSDALLRQ